MRRSPASSHVPLPPLLLPPLCRATECAGHVAKSVGRAAFERFLAPSLALASAGYALDYLELQENTFAFFACIVEVLAAGGGTDLPPLVAELAPLTLRVVCDESADLEVVRGEGDGDGGDNLADRLHELRSAEAGGGAWRLVVVLLLLGSPAAPTPCSSPSQVALSPARPTTTTTTLPTPCASATA